MLKTIYSAIDTYERESNSSYCLQGGAIVSALEFGVDGNAATNVVIEVYSESKMIPFFFDNVTQKSKNNERTI